MSKDTNQQEALKTLNPSKVWIPLLIGLGISVFFMYQIDFGSISQKIVNAKIRWFIVAVFVLLSRDVGYIYRIRTLTNGKLDWTASIYVILLWEFSSAVTPSVVGGTAVAVFILNREGINFGESMAYAMLTAMFDNLFFLMFAPLAMLGAYFIGLTVFPDFAIETGWLKSIFNENTLQGAFLVSYLLIALYTFIFIYGLFLNPRGFKWILIKCTSISFLRRWRHAAVKTGDDVIVASKELKGHNFNYWFKVTLSTIFIWIARYFMLNCIIAAFTGVNLFEHLLIFARQIVMWIVMLISPTPGSTGTAEYAFAKFYQEILGGSEDLSKALALIWRLFYYYPYLIIGGLILPSWLRRVYKKSKQKKETKAS